MIYLAGTDFSHLTDDELINGIKALNIPDYIRSKSYGIDVRETLAQMTEMLMQLAYNQGMDPQQAKEWVSQLNNKIVKGQVTMSDLTQEVKEALTGGSVAVVGVNAVDTKNVKDGAIDRSKTNYYTARPKNIFTIDGYQPDIYYVYNSGAVSTLSGWNTTKMLSVYPGEKYESNVNGQITFWSKDGNYVSGQNNGTTISPIVIPQNVYGMRHAIKDEVIANPEKYHITGENSFEDPQLIVKASQIEGLESIIQKSKYDGKIIANLGDSITDFNNVVRHGILTVGYQHYLETELGCTTVELAKSGHTMQQIYTDYVVPNNFANYDAVTLFAGTNNYAQNQESSLGEVLPIDSNFDTTTFTGSYQKAIEKIYADNPHIRIYLIVPQKGWYTSYPTANGVSSDMTTAIPNKIIEIAELYNLPVLDLYRHSGINRLTADVYINDGTASFRFHPSNDGYKKMAELIVPFIENH